MKNLNKIKNLLTLIISFTILSCSTEEIDTTDNVTNISVAKSDTKQILSFVFTTDDNIQLREAIAATIDETNHTITARVPFGTDLTSLVPTIEVSTQARVNITGLEDFTNPVAYIVTAEDGTTVEYTSDFTIDNSSLFITTWKTTSDNESITIYVNSSINGYDYDIDWGDGKTENYLTDNTSHEYATAGTYTVKIRGDFPAFYSSSIDIANNKKLQSIENWGDIEWETMSNAFANCINLVYNATDIPNLSNVTDMSFMFYNASSFNGDLSGWDISEVIDMSSMFESASSFNSDLSGWNTNNVTNCSEFSSDSGLTESQLPSTGLCFGIGN